MICLKGNSRILEILITKEILTLKVRKIDF